jgi:hypothetical protein
VANPVKEIKRASSLWFQQKDQCGFQKMQTTYLKIHKRKMRRYSEEDCRIIDKAYQEIVKAVIGNM